MFIYILKIKQHYFICNTPSLRCGILRLQTHPADIAPFYQWNYWKFCSVSILILLKFRKSLIKKLLSAIP